MTKDKTVTMSRELRSVLSMILNALDRDAEEGKQARAEMAQELRQVLAAPVVERQEPVAVPVAWMRFDDDQRAIFTRSKRTNRSEPLYAHPTAYRHASPPAPVAVPEGWKLVPVEPTEAMLNVLHDRVLISVDSRKQEANILNDKAWWRAVVEAAPACLDKVKELNQ